MGIFRILTTVVKTGSKEIAQNRQSFPGDWKYDILNAPMKEVSKKGLFSYKGGLFQAQNYPYLRDSDELWPLVNAAIKSHNKENAMKIIQHLRTYNAGSSQPYAIIIKTIKKAFKEIDITDLF